MIVETMNGTTYRFSLRYKPGEMNIHTWYRTKGEVRKRPASAATFK